MLQSIYTRCLKQRAAVPRAGAPGGRGCAPSRPARRRDVRRGQRTVRHGHPYRSARRPRPGRGGRARGGPGNGAAAAAGGGGARGVGGERRRPSPLPGRAAGHHTATMPQSVYTRCLKQERGRRAGGRRRAGSRGRRAGAPLSPPGRGRTRAPRPVPPRRPCIAPTRRAAHRSATRGAGNAAAAAAPGHIR